MVIVITIGSTVALFSCLLLLTKRPLAEPEMTASGFLLLLVLPMLEKLVLNGDLPLQYMPSSLLAGAPLGFGPFLYLYTKSVVEPRPEGFLRVIAHFVPFAASIVFLAWGPPGPPSATEADSGGVLPVLSWVLVPSLLWYSILVFRTLGRHRKKVPEFFSRHSLAVNLKWLTWVTGAFVLMYMLVIVGALGGSLEIDLGTTVFLAVFSFAALKQPQVFRPEIAEGNSAKYEKSGLREKEAVALLGRLKDHMDTSQPWLDPDLTIENLAAALAVSRHHVTQVLNETLGKNFYHFVNEYRIEEVKRKISDGEADRLSLLGVAFDAGFNSKSTFNEAFKRILGTTPSAYRKSVRA